MAWPYRSSFRPALFLRHFRDDREQMGRVYGLWNVVLESGQECFATIFRPSICRQRRRRDLAAAHTHTVDESEAVRRSS